MEEKHISTAAAQAIDKKGPEILLRSFSKMYWQPSGKAFFFKIKFPDRDVKRTFLTTFKPNTRRSAFKSNYSDATGLLGYEVRANGKAVAERYYKLLNAFCTLNQIAVLTEDGEIVQDVFNDHEEK